MHLYPSSSSSQAGILFTNKPEPNEVSRLHHRHILLMLYPLLYNPQYQVSHTQNVQYTLLN
jgi:hypothetical protein